MDVNQAQTILAKIGLLDPPADGVLGPVTVWALREFCNGAGVPFDGATISDAIAAKLAAATPLALAPGNDLVGRIVSAMITKGHWVARHPDCVNIVYVEGMNADGTPNDNLPNEFNDRRMVIRVVDGIPRIERSWEATTEPGRYWTEHPMNVKGAARIAFGQYKAWTVGDYHGSESLLQAAPIPVYRDLAQHYKREGAPDVGMFGIEQHWGYDLSKQDLGRSSAGCLVGRATAGHREFMALVKTDARYRASPGYRFLTTVLPVEALRAGQAIPSALWPTPPQPSATLSAQPGDTPRLPVQPQIGFATLQQLFAQLNTAFAGMTSAGAAPTLSPIDKALGGEAMVGLKTPLAIVAYAALWMMQTFDAVGPATGDKATATGSVLTALIAAFGGLGVTAKFDRAFQAIEAIAPLLRKVAAIAAALPK